MTKKWDKVFKSGISKFCGRQSLKNFKGYCVPCNFLKAVFHKIYLVHSWILSLKYCKALNICEFAVGLLRECSLSFLCIWLNNAWTCPLEQGRKGNVHKTFRRRPWHKLSCNFSWLLKDWFTSTYKIQEGQIYIALRFMDGKQKRFTMKPVLRERSTVT